MRGRALVDDHRVRHVQPRRAAVEVLARGGLGAPPGLARGVPGQGSADDRRLHDVVQGQAGVEALGEELGVVERAVGGVREVGGEEDLADAGRGRAGPVVS
ncbi:MAG TPA: hypothetical protein VMT87_13240 [Vicinamibacteria bacterium]|nr:hypothetical protein [Vicinamibacteria bacterium]